MLKTNAELKILKSLTVLIIEDDDTSLKLEASLAALAFGKVITAVNGHDGWIKYLEYFSQNGEYPDVVVTDLEMPKKNGFQLISDIKACHPKQYTIVISSHNESDSFVKLIDIGVDKFLFKPINYQVFLQTAKDVVEKISQNKLLEAQERLMQENEERFNIAVDGNGDGLWDWNILKGSVFFSSGWKAMLGFHDYEISNSLEEWESRVNPLHLPQVHKDIQAYLRGETQFYENEHQLLCKNGEYKWILDRGVVVEKDDLGQPTRMIGTHSDISEKKESELILRAQKEEFETIFNINLDGLAILDLETRFLKVNKSYCDLTGFTEVELYDLSCKDLTKKEDEERITELFLQVLEKGYVENFEKRCLNKSGMEIIVNVSIALMPDKERFLISARDITCLKQQEQIIKSNLNIIDQHIITFATDKFGQVTELSSSFIERTGLTQNQVIGQDFLALIDQSTPSISLEVLENEKDVWKGEVKLAIKSEQVFWLSVEAIPRIVSNIKVGFAFICHDISDKKQLEVISITDPMTKLFNRRQFESSFFKMFNSSRRTNSSLVLMMLDIDHFKAFNDIYGHQKGDEALIKVAECLLTSFQRADDMCFRLGGEEFAVIFKCDDIKNALFYGNKLLEKVMHLNLKHSKNTPFGCLTLSIGLLYIKSDCQPIELSKVYKEADSLLYQAKNNGRNRLCSSYYLPKLP